MLTHNNTDGNTERSRTPPTLESHDMSWRDLSYEHEWAHLRECLSVALCMIAMLCAETNEKSMYS